MKVALVYDRINKWGGAESVLLALHEMYPEAPLFTSVYDPVKAPWAKTFAVRPSFLQKTPVPKDRHEYYPYLMGLAFESFNFEDFDVVISVTSEFAKAIITKPRILHLCYCLTPTSYLWSGYQAYFSSLADWQKTLYSPVVRYLRFYDQIICHRPDKYIAISQTVAGRIKKYYHLESSVIYPPVSLPEKTEINLPEDYYLMVARLVPNKSLDYVIRAFNTWGKELKIVGVGRDEARLKKIAKRNIEFLGYLSPEDLIRHYKRCLAVIVPGVEDFGIVALEAQSYGKPVIAFRQGGSTETVLENKTGFFFKEQNSHSLLELLKKVDLNDIQPLDCITNANRFSKANFQRQLANFVDYSLDNYV